MKNPRSLSALNYVFGRHATARRSNRRSRGPKPKFASQRSCRLEALEPRVVLAAPTFATALPTQLEVPAGAPLNIALNGFDADGDALTFTAVSDDPGLVDPLINNDNRSLRITVRNTDPADPFQGDMVFELFEGRAPLTTSKIIEVAEKGDLSFAFDGGFDGMIFHRVSEDFVIQTGDPTGTGTSGALPMAFDDEFNSTLLHTSKGILSMANSGDDTNNSQFFVTDRDTRFLDGNHAVFGFQTEGDAIREMVQNVPVDNSNGPGDGRPLSDVILEEAEVFLDEENGVLSLVAPHGMTGTTNVTVTVSDGNEIAIHVIQVTVVQDTINTDPFLAKIDDVETAAGVPVILQLEAIDPEGDPPVFEAVSQHTELEVTRDQVTGEVTITPNPTFVGLGSIRVGVRRPTDFSGFDTQSVPVFVTPTAPSGIEVVGAIDGPDGPITDNNNGLLVQDRIRFRVSGIFQATSVFVVIDPDTPNERQIAQFTAPAPTDPLQIVEVEFDSNGPLSGILADGQHVIAVRQDITGLNNIGNNNEIVTLRSEYSDSIILTVDTSGPTFLSTPITEVQVGALYVYDVETDDEQVSFAEYELLDGSPAGMSINPQTGEIVWLTMASDVGIHSVDIRAYDALRNFNEQSFTINVLPPEVDAKITIAPDDTNEVGEPHTFIVTVMQDDGRAAEDPLGDGVDGFTPASDGTVVLFVIENTNGATAALDDTADENFDTIFDNDQIVPISGGMGMASITINSNTAGQVIANAFTTVTVGGVAITRDTDPATDPVSGPGMTDPNGPATKTFVVITPDFQGCTHGYWKSNANNAARKPEKFANEEGIPLGWVATGVHPGDPLSSVGFSGFTTLDGDATSFLDALSLGGAGENALMRQAAAAYLNAAHPDVNYPLTTQEVTEQVSAALASGDPDAVNELKNQLDEFNNLFCSIDQFGRPQVFMMPGDGNLSGNVDAADYTIWANDFGIETPRNTDGDYNGDGSVDSSDYSIWASNFGLELSTPQGASSVVREDSVSGDVESFAVAVDSVLGSMEMNWAMYMLFEDLLDDETDE